MSLHYSSKGIFVNLGIWIVNIVCAAGVAYFVTFAGATLALGRALSTADTKTGYQDAVTPPWVGQVTVLVYGVTIAVIAASWYFFGAYRGCISIALIVVGVLVTRQCMPKEDSAHYKILIIQSMVRRHADYVRYNDSLRAAVMKELLERAGVPIDQAAPSSPVAS